MTGRCQNSVSLLCGSPAAMTANHVVGPGGAPLEIGTRYVLIRHGPTPNLPRANMLTMPTLSDFGNLMSAWFAIYEECDRALNTYFGLIYAPPTFAEIQLITAVIAAEGLHSGLVAIDVDEKAKTGKRRGNILSSIEPSLQPEDFAWVEALLKNAGGPNLRRRLQELWQLGSGSTGSLIPNGEKWAQSITHERNNLSHPGGRKLSDLQLYIGGLTVSSVISIVVVQKLASNSGVTLTDPAQLPNLRHLAEQIQEHLPEWTDLADVSVPH